MRGKQRPGWLREVAGAKVWRRTEYGRLLLTVVRCGQPYIGTCMCEYHTLADRFFEQKMSKKKVLSQEFPVIPTQEARKSCIR